MQTVAAQWLTHTIVISLVVSGSLCPTVILCPLCTQMLSHSLGSFANIIEIITKRCFAIDPEGVCVQLAGVWECSIRALSSCFLQHLHFELLGASFLALNLISCLPSFMARFFLLARRIFLLFLDSFTKLRVSTVVVWVLQVVTTRNYVNRAVCAHRWRNLSSEDGALGCSAWKHCLAPITSTHFLGIHRVQCGCTEKGRKCCSSRGAQLFLIAVICMLHSVTVWVHPCLEVVLFFVPLFLQSFPVCFICSCWNRRQFGGTH